MAVYSNSFNKRVVNLGTKVGVYILEKAKMHYFFKSKLQVLSFMFTSNCRRCPFDQNFIGGVLYLSKSCTLCPLGQT
ncbi:hypothetical protein Hanom_Chr16g01473921 [Helianthus anomalus]